jgi:hypothetical protein
MGGVTDTPFIAAHIAIPDPPSGPGFVLTPLGTEHNEGDLDAWSSSVEHIHGTAGFAGHPWPDEPMTLERNLGDLQGHVDDFAARRGFTYSVLSDPGGQVIGCVYIYPAPDEGIDASVRSWVRASHAELDGPLYRTVTDWLAAAWPFTSVAYAPRPAEGAERLES